MGWVFVAVVYAVGWFGENWLWLPALALGYGARAVLGG